MLHHAKRRAVFVFGALLPACGFFGLAWRAVLARSARPAPTGSAVNSAGFRLALPGYEYSFPRDHGSHPAYQTEWWYYTGHLQSTRGEKNFGYELTFFRQALVPELKNRKSEWAARDVILAHLALTDESGGRFYFCDRAGRAALQLAGAQTAAISSQPRIWLNDWEMQFLGRDGDEQRMEAAGTDARSSTPFAVALQQRSSKKPAIHGENGISQKSAGRGRASHYYSLMRLETTGKVWLAGDEYSVTGQSWFDHEFGSNQLATDQAGWDWFSLQFDDGRELMLYQLRTRSGGVDPYSSGTLVARDGQSQHLKAYDFEIEVLDQWRSPHSGAKYPARWKLRLPRQNMELRIAPTLADQELDTGRSTGVTYWEGSVAVRGAQNGKTLLGRGYAELTGYARPFDETF